MPTQVERQILSDFEARLRESADVPEGLRRRLVELLGDEKIPSADALLASIKANVGDQPV